MTINTILVLFETNHHSFSTMATAATSTTTTAAGGAGGGAGADAAPAPPAPAPSARLFDIRGGPRGALTKEVATELVAKAFADGSSDYTAAALGTWALDEDSAAVSSSKKFAIIPHTDTPPPLYTGPGGSVG